MSSAVAYRAPMVNPSVPQSFLTPGLDEFFLLRVPTHGILDAFLFVHQEFGFEVFYVIVFTCV
jgi:hypothetical protein